MHRRRIAALLLVGALGTLSACGGDDGGGDKGAVPTAAKPQPGVVVSKGTGYDITLPKGWQVSDRTEDVDAEFEVVGRTVGGVQVHGSFVEDAYFQLGETTPIPTLKQYVSTFRAANKDGIAVGAPKPIELDGMPAYVSDFAVIRGGKRLRVRKVQTLYDGGALTLILTAPADQFDALVPEFDSILDSWGWKASSDASDVSTPLSDGSTCLEWNRKSEADRQAYADQAEGSVFGSAHPPTTIKQVYAYRHASNAREWLDKSCAEKLGEGFDAADAHTFKVNFGSDFEKSLP